MKRPAINFLALLILTSCLSACTRNENAAGNTDPTQNRIVPVDSIVVDDIITQLFLFQTADQDHLVFRDKGNSRVFVTNHQGQRLYEWEKEGDIPGSFSAIADAFELNDNGQLVIHDNLSGARVLDLQGNLVMENRVFQPQSGISVDINLFRKNQVITRGDKSYLLHHLDLMDEVQEINPSFYKKRQNLLMTDLETGEVQQLLPFPADSKFVSGKAYPFEDFRPVFHYDHQNKILDVLFQNEPVLYSYDWSSEDPVLLDATRLDLPNFRENQGWEYGEIVYGKLNSQGLDSPFPGKIQSLEKIGDSFLISYLPSPHPDELDSWLRTSKGEGSPESKITREKMKTKTYLFQKTTKQLSRLDLPRMHYSSFRVIGEDIWWMKPLDPSVEVESFTVYRGRLEE